MSAADPSTLLHAIRSAFAAAPRPAAFVDASHCCECAEHEQTLSAHAPETIGLAELGNPGWDPICFVGVEGYLYYLPALARLALGRGREAYVDSFLFHLTPERSARFTEPQRTAVLDFLRALPGLLGEDLLADGSGIELERRIAQLAR